MTTSQTSGSSYLRVGMYKQHNDSKTISIRCVLYTIFTIFTFYCKQLSLDIGNVIVFAIITWGGVACCVGGRQILLLCKLIPRMPRDLGAK